MRSVLFVGLVAFGAFACSSTTEGAPCDGPDKYEPNDSPSAARDLGNFTDDPDSTMHLDLTLPGGTDVDFFRFKVLDRGFGGNPIVTVSAPEGYEVTTWFTCTSGSPVNFSCSRGKENDEPSVTSSTGCINIQPSGSVSSSTDCSGTDTDDGTVLLRVRRLDTSNQCASAFNITIEVT
jgi:hypothetical protein